jgi:hypothetical protein
MEARQYLQCRSECACVCVEGGARVSVEEERGGRKDSMQPA